MTRIEKLLGFGDYRFDIYDKGIILAFIICTILIIISVGFPKLSWSISNSPAYKVGDILIDSSGDKITIADRWVSSLGHFSGKVNTRYGDWGYDFEFYSWKYRIEPSREMGHSDWDEDFEIFISKYYKRIE